MATAKWGAPGSRSSNLAGTTLNSLATGSESTVVTYDNSTARFTQGIVTVKLGSITPVTDGAILLRINSSDGVDVPDRAAGDIYQAALLSGASAKVVSFSLVRLYPFSMRLSVINRAGVTFASTGNEIYITPYPEDVT